MKLLQKIGGQITNAKMRWLWIAVGLLLVGLHIAIMFQSRRFAVTGSGIMAMLFFEVVACGLYLIIVGIVRLHYVERFHLAGIIFIGVLLRLIMMLPMSPQSNDYYRYLWDGAVTAHGINPYLYSPESIIEGQASDDNSSTLSDLRQLSEKAGETFSRINNPGLRTIYPPVAQGLFALAYWVMPFQLEGWRIILLVFDILAVIILLFILHSAQLPSRYLAVYLWNPLLLYESHRCGHLDLIVGALILLFVWALMYRRAVIAGATLALAVGVKLWPLLLVPFLIVSLLRNRKELVAGLGVFAGLTVLIMIPFAAAMKHWPDSGVIAYAQTWEANTGIYWVFNWFGGRLAEIFASGMDGRIIARGMVVLILLIVSIWQAKHAGKDASQLCRRIGIVFVLMLLLSPTVFPWYYVAVIPLAAISIRWTFLIWTLLLPMSHFTDEANNHNILMLITYLPVWLLWMWECVRSEIPLRERPAMNV